MDACNKIDFKIDCGISTECMNMDTGNQHYSSIISVSVSYCFPAIVRHLSDRNR